MAHDTKSKAIHAKTGNGSKVMNMNYGRYRDYGVYSVKGGHVKKKK